MSKLNELLAQKETLSEEVSGLGKFLHHVETKGTLVMSAVDDVSDDESEVSGIMFTDEDYKLEVTVLAPLVAHYEKRAKKLAAVERKLAALEELMN